MVAKCCNCMLSVWLPHYNSYMQNDMPYIGQTDLFQSTISQIAISPVTRQTGCHSGTSS